MTAKNPKESLKSENEPAGEPQAKANEALDKEIKEQLAYAKKLIEESQRLVKERLKPLP